MLMALTGRKRVFADAVLAGLTNKKAAIKAQYSEATASAAGSRLVKDKQVAEYLATKRAAAQKPAPEPELPQVIQPATDGKQFDPRPMLEQIALGLVEVSAQQYKALTALLPYTNVKLGEGGKKDAAGAKAKEAGAGKFGSAAPPRLAAVGGRKT
jgi:phage terminase small subunit